MTEQKKRGFASMSPERQKEIASKGGKSAHLKGTAHRWSSAEAVEAGRKGGMAARGGRGKVGGEAIVSTVGAPFGGPDSRS
jgi:general stress protein YciG